MTPIGAETDGLVLRKIQDAYLSGSIRKTKDFISDMTRTGIFEVDVEKVIMDAALIEQMDYNPSNNQYLIHGSSTKGAQMCCVISVNNHPHDINVSYWLLTSFENKQGN